MIFRQRRRCRADGRVSLTRVGRRAPGPARDAVFVARPAAVGRERELVNARRLSLCPPSCFIVALFGPDRCSRAGRWPSGEGGPSGAGPGVTPFDVCMLSAIRWRAVRPGLRARSRRHTRPADEASGFRADRSATRSASSPSSLSCCSAASCWTCPDSAKTRRRLWHWDDVGTAHPHSERREALRASGRDGKGSAREPRVLRARAERAGWLSPERA